MDENERSFSNLRRPSAKLFVPQRKAKFRKFDGPTSDNLNYFKKVGGISST